MVSILIFGKLQVKIFLDLFVAFFDVYKRRHQQMIRRVAFGKAIFAGVAGALAWEAAARLLSVAGVGIFDIVRVLGLMISGSEAPAWQWWPIGLAMHCGVGAIWAIFYAFFFWSNFDMRPAFQGTLFSLLPAVLAGLVMVPQVELMHPDLYGAFRPFAIGLGFWGPAMIVIGHLIYGLVMGSFYVRPVGYPVGTRIKLHV